MKLSKNLPLLLFIAISPFFYYCNGSSDPEVNGDNVKVKSDSNPVAEDTPIQEDTTTIGNSQEEEITGKIGSSSEFGSGWIDLDPSRNFRAGDVLTIKVGGTANYVVVRLLPEGASPDSPTGIVGSKRRVPTNRVVTIVLDSDRNRIKQISVHGNSIAFDFDLGANNGPAKLMQVLLRRR